MSQVWIDGALVDKNDARVSVFDHGLLFGDGVTVGMRAYGGTVFRIAEYLDQLSDSAGQIRLKLTLSRDDFASAIRATLAANNRADGYIRVIVTRGAGTLGLDPRKCEPTVIIIAEEVAPFPRELYAVGVDVITAERSRPVEIPGTLSRVANVMAKAKALTAGYLEALMVSDDGLVLGGSETDVAVVTGRTLRMNEGGGGVHRFVAELAAQAGLTVTVGPLPLVELQAADEVFLTSTEAELIGVRSVDGRPVGAGGEGPVTRRLREAFRAATRGGPGILPV
jgi:branched-chain amino acid aminotransferase